MNRHGGEKKWNLTYKVHKLVEEWLKLDTVIFKFDYTHRVDLVPRSFYEEAIINAVYISRTETNMYSLSMFFGCNLSSLKELAKANLVRFLVIKFHDCR